ncbi:MAG: hypothetical protein OEW73_15750 [Gammaproteobacteria bacterium]|nr:hypothetical protein [Gammaproteobacteria bacterium]MDH5242220.1 hypothetical protein [Gammaproteobacteria bacterium]MDH5259778.1 hypothetical protein [Gammaproteobacteria bacterium]MDH5582879.1 hypothetical protein [Gammaproteobacteria bacterium]
MSILEELKRRNVFRVGIAYAVASWLLLQIVDIVLPIIEAPEWVSKAILLLIATGFPLALLFAWAFELTAEGLKFERDVDRSQSIAPKTGRNLDRMIIGILVIALAWFAMDKFIWSAAPSEDAVAAKRSIAVLPFVNMSGDPEQSFFSDGISEEILNTLVRAEGISVASRTSSFNFKNHEQSIPVIAEELGVLFVLEGSVRKSGDQLRITAQLIDAENDRHLWSETYDRDLSDIFAVQSDIANSITTAIYNELGIARKTDIFVKTLTEDMTAYDLYLKGSQAFFHRLKTSDMQNAMAWLEQAVATDPDFAAAWETLAGVYSAIPYWGDQARTLEEYIQLSDDAADRALRLDPNLSFAVGIKANNFLSFPRYDLKKAFALFDEAIAKDPQNSTLQHWWGNTLLQAGYLEKGLAAQQRCLDIDPAYLNCALYMEQALHALGRHHAAAELVDRYFEKTTWAHINAVRVPEFLLAGNRLAALLAASRILGLDGAPNYEFVFALENPGADHSEGLRKYDIWAQENQVRLDDYPEIIAAFGAYDRIDNQFNSELWYWLPPYKHFRQTAQFKALMRKLGFYDYWLDSGFPPQCRAIGDDDFACD